MSGGGFGDFGLSDIAFDAIDLGSIVTDFGTEFMSSLDITSFDIGLGDVAGLGGFDIAGSFAGNAGWFDTFNPGAILSSIPSVSDFSLPSLVSSLPALSSLNSSNIIDTATRSLGINIPSVPGITGPLNTSGLVAAGAAALGISIPSVPGVTGPLNTGGLVSAGAAALGIPPSLTAPVTAILNNAAAPINVAQAGLGTPGILPGLATNIVSDAAPVNPNTAVLNLLPAAGSPIPIPNSNTTTDIPSSDQYSIFKNQDGTYGVLDRNTGDTVSDGLSEQQALLAEQDLNIVTPGFDTNSTAVVTGQEDPFEAARLAIESESRANGPTEADVISASNGITVGQVNNARFQQAIRELRNNKAQATDWRVRLRLAPGSSYLYKADPPGVLQPLTDTDGVIFPYTPSIDTAYKANYSSYDLTHSNYRGYFYQNSYVDAVNLRAMFTAQDTNEANYLLAVIHFFRSVTKMFYGQEAQRGSPPPLVYLSGYGDYQFAEHPCVVSQFNYTLPTDVDYIRAQQNLSGRTNQLNNRLRNPIVNNPLAYSANRLLNNKLLLGALDFRPTEIGTGNLATGNPTYVPTKMEISILLLPIQSRSQVSNNFSLRAFANGNLLKGGYW